MSTTSGPVDPLRIGRSIVLPPMLIFAVSAMPVPFGRPCRETPVRTAYSALAVKRKRIVHAAKTFVFSERYEGAGEVGRGRAAREHCTQGRADLSEADAFGLGEGAVQGLEAGDRPVRRRGVGVAQAAERAAGF